MDPKRFDNWTRKRALRLSRRDALKTLAAAGVVTALPEAALAQGTCTFTLDAETAGGPSAPATYQGTLQLTLGNDGAFTAASFTQSGDVPKSTTGHAVGRAVDFQIELAPGQVLSFSGASEHPLDDCQGAVAGLFSGPQPGDLGGWQATTGATGTASASQSSSSASTSQGFSLTCPPPQTACGAACCPGGATCTNSAQGLCSCPDGTLQCGISCVPKCSDGQALDLDTCTCPDPEAACIPNQQTCQNHGQCCSGYCGGGTCFDCAGKVCGDFGCIDPNKDSQNCGNCGNVCILPQVCSNGVCGCAADDAPCVDHSECCSQYCSTFGACETCSNIISSGPGAPSAPSTFCGAGVCVDLRINIDHCGACFRACPRTSGGIVCDAGVCHDINNDADYCGFGAEVCAPGMICRFGDCVAA
jgi:hypothetical protein